MANGKDKVSWVMADEKILKLEKLDKTYEISDVVFKFMERDKLLAIEDFEVDVEIDETKGENGTITKLVPLNVKTEPEKQKKEESKPETVKTDNVIKTLTVGGVAVAKKGIIFKEEDGVWYTLSDDLDAQDIKDKATRKTVEINVSPQSKGNDIIVSLTVMEPDSTNTKEKVQENIQKTNTSSNYQTNTQKSIEAQASVNNAQILAGCLFDKTVKISELDEFISSRAMKNYDLIQELKSK